VKPRAASLGADAVRSAAPATPATARALASLRRLGLLRGDAPVEALELEGGVSADVVAVAAPGLRVIVKRALPRLRVEQEWLATEERVATEAAALRLADELTPGAVPRVLAFDEADGQLVLEHAPPGWRDWRSQLLGGSVETGTARRLGELLSRWHHVTAGRALPRFESLDPFVQLRIDPFHRTVAVRHPDLADRVDRVARRLLGARVCLVHGDFSPKNVLTGGDGLWVIDWEVAHIGDPVFDVAFLCTHLLLKAVHRPVDAERYRAAASGFLTAYGELDEAALVAGTGCLLVARVDGKSPAPYLDERARADVRALGRRLLLEPPQRLLDAWELV
jgi:aminoglycoside phosphotransferase (APT) family kinase protein